MPFYPLDFLSAVENAKTLIDVIESGIFTEVSAVFAKDLLPKYVIC